MPEQNNSGKTSLVELFSVVFGEKKGKFGKEDIPAEERYKWSAQVYSVFASAFLSGDNKKEILPYRTYAWNSIKTELKHRTNKSFLL